MALDSTVWSAEAWLRSLDLAAAAAKQLVTDGTPAPHQLEELKMLTRAQVEAALRAAVAEMADGVMQAIESLRADGTAAEIHSRVRPACTPHSHDKPDR